MKTHNSWKKLTTSIIVAFSLICVSGISNAFPNPFHHHHSGGGGGGSHSSSSSSFSGYFPSKKDWGTIISDLNSIPSILKHILTQATDIAGSTATTAEGIGKMVESVVNQALSDADKSTLAIMSSQPKLETQKLANNINYNKESNLSLFGSTQDQIVQQQLEQFKQGFTICSDDGKNCFNTLSSLNLIAPLKYSATELELAKQTARNLAGKGIAKFDTAKYGPTQQALAYHEAYGRLAAISSIGPMINGALISTREASNNSPSSLSNLMAACGISSQFSASSLSSIGKYSATGIAYTIPSLMKCTLAGFKHIGDGIVGVGMGINGVLSMARQEIVDTTFAQKLHDAEAAAINIAGTSLKKAPHE